MVYENLTISTKQLRLAPLEGGLQAEQQLTASLPDQPSITVTLQTLPVQIFVTCHTVYSEALPFLTRKLDKIRETIPTISVDSDCLYMCALDSTQKLLRSVLDDLNQHPFFQPKPGVASVQLKKDQTRQQYPQEVYKWLAQTTHLLLSQRPPPCPFSGFMGARTYPTVRLVIEVSKVWRCTNYRGLAVESPPYVETPSMYTTSISTQLTEVWNDLGCYTKGLKHIHCGAIVFGQDNESKDGLVAKKTFALDFGICRVVE